mgnify:FL=1
MSQETSRGQMLYQLDDKPPALTAAFVGFQHLLAIIGGILTAPFLIALGMGLGAGDTAYLIGASLVVSGVATFVQIHRFGILGAGLLSIQGTSFAFIGTMIFAYQFLIDDMSSQEALGIIFGSSAVCAGIIFILSFFIRSLRRVITANVAGATIILIGLSLIQSTIVNLANIFSTEGGFAGQGFSRLLLAMAVFVTILFVATRRNVWLRLSSISIGLLVGIVGAMQLGHVDFGAVRQAELFFFPEFAHYPFAVNIQVVVLILPIFLVSAMESIGDITATNNLSGLQTGTPDYWLRVRGGILATAFNSLVAALFCSFPSTTFSQNNGVIRLTGVSSRHVGKYVAGFLVALGCLPAFTALFQAIPSEVVFGATLLMFILVTVSGFKVIEFSNPKRRDWIIVCLAIVLGYGFSIGIQSVPGVPAGLLMVLQFPVSAGAIVALFLEIIVPRNVSADA